MPPAPGRRDGRVRSAPPGLLRPNVQEFVAQSAPSHCSAAGHNVHATEFRPKVMKNATVIDNQLSIDWTRSNWDSGHSLHSFDVKKKGLEKRVVIPKYVVGATSSDDRPWIIFKYEDKFYERLYIHGEDPSLPFAISELLPECVICYDGFDESK